MLITSAGLQRRLETPPPPYDTEDFGPSAIQLSLSISICNFQCFYIIFGSGADGCGPPGVFFLFYIYDPRNRSLFPPTTNIGRDLNRVPVCVLVKYRVPPISVS